MAVRIRQLLQTVGFALALSALCNFSQAGNNGFRQSSVGGVSVDAAGVVKNSTVDVLNDLRQRRLQAQTKVSDDLAEKVELRKISLKRMMAETKKAQDAGKDIPDEVHHLAGIQRIKYVFVYPEENDIVFAGPAEGWKLDAAGNVVGMTTNQPVLQLDDLLIAVRSADELLRGSITCSIDPTQEGMARLQQFVKAQGGNIGANAQQTITGIEEALGPQTVTFGGVDPTTRFARVLLAADYRMKRLAMGFEKSPVPGMKSFLDMTTGASDMFPRWWLTTNYDPLLKSEDGLAWELRGPGVKAMTQDAFFSANGARTTTNKVNPVAQKWADDMTKGYDRLASSMPIFGELRNVMDMAVLAALVSKENLIQKSGLDLSVLRSSTLTTDEMNAPRNISTQASFIKRGRNYIISASGGVEIRPASVLQRFEESPTLTASRKQNATSETNWQWWWN